MYFISLLLHQYIIYEMQNQNKYFLVWILHQVHVTKQCINGVFVGQNLVMKRNTPYNYKLSTILWVICLDHYLINSIVEQLRNSCITKFDQYHQLVYISLYSYFVSMTYHQMPTYAKQHQNEEIWDESVSGFVHLKLVHQNKVREIREGANVNMFVKITSSWWENYRLT